MNRFKTRFLLLWLTAALAFPAGSFAKDGASQALEMARQLNQAFVEVADQVSPAVVVIMVSQKRSLRNPAGDDSLWDLVPPELRRRFEGGRPERRRGGTGSGIVITEDGYILTNNHVVENADKIRVRFKDGKEWDAEIKGTDPESDIAVIKIKATGLHAAKLGDSDKTRVGEFAIAIGAPFDLNYSVTVGHISGKGRSFFDPEAYTDQDFIQTDACINPGNSGGPLVNLYGEVIGINSMIRMNSGIGFAIPINLAKRVKDHLINEGKFTRSWLGVRIVELKDYLGYKDLDSSLVPDVEEGVVIDAIEARGPASKSELKPSDVVVAVDGVPVKTPRQLKDQISSKKAGQTVVLDVVRGKKHMEVKVKTESLSPESADASRQDNSSTEAFTYGLNVQTLTKQLAEQNNIEMIAGVLVAGVEPNSPAFNQGIKPGDVITEINRKSVTSAKEFVEALKSAAPKRGMIVNLVSNGTSKFVLLKEGE